MHIMKEEFHGALAMVSHSRIRQYTSLSQVSWAHPPVRQPAAPACENCTGVPVRFTFCLKQILPRRPVFQCFAKGAHWVLSSGKVGDTAIIDNGIVNGSAKLVGAIAAQVRKDQNCFIYTYAAARHSAYWYCSALTFWGLFR